MQINSRVQFKDSAIATVERKLVVLDELQFAGDWNFEHWRNGELIGIHEMDNSVTNVGKNDLLDKYFRNGTPPAAWYGGLIDSSGFTAFAAGDTAASHSGWNEFTNYSQATRVAWGPDAASGQALTNSTRMTFDITGSGTIKGVMMISVSTKGGTTGILWATTAFTVPPTVDNGDQLKATYNLSC